MPHTEQSPSKHAVVIKHALLLIAGLIIGWINGAPALGFAIAAAASLAWHLYMLLSFTRWAYEDDAALPPLGNSIWNKVFARVQHFRNRMLFHQEHVLQLEQASTHFIDSLPDPWFVLNSNYEVESCNYAAMDFLNLTSPPNGIVISNLIRDPQFVSALEKEEFDDRVTVTTPLDPSRTYLSTITELGEVRRLLHLADISSRVKAMQMRSDFIANASHELRTPVTVLRGYLDTLTEDDSIPANIGAPLKSMNEQVARMQSVITDLMTLNVLESKDPASTTNVVEMANLLNAACADARLTANQRHIELQGDGAHNLYGSQSDLQSIVSNLLSNAIRFSPDQDKISLSWRVSDRGGELTVTDSGIGITTQELERVTERFYRTDAGRARHQFGTGLGLAIVKHALVRHDAELNIVSNVRAGSQFKCLFPIARIATNAD